MRRFFSITVSLAFLPILALPVAAQAQDSLEGAWELTRATDEDGNAVEAMGMMVFSDGFYSWIRIFEGDRPNYADQEVATDAQKLAAFESFGANSGSYTVSGSTLTRDPVAAKNPYVYAPDSRIVGDFEIEGDTLTLTQPFGVEVYTRLN